jgi:hypothetical protein
VRGGAGEAGDGTANYFDHMTPAYDETMALLTSDTGQHVSAAVVHGRSLASSNKDAGLEYRVRRYDSYFIASLIDLASSKAKAGKVYYMCYFFKKVHD